ncbi:MAG: DUF3793 family protein [Oscillospiraceae bacterium]|nr:DUF3793 family protein [Oscillospiraceae bacterium]
MCNNRYFEFEQKLAFHTAPSLLGIKCASLMSIARDSFDEMYLELFNCRAAVKGLRIKILCMCEERVLLLLYNENKLAAQLSREECRGVLRIYGYADSMDMEACLERLSVRIGENRDFPHEIGIFLDYPVEDVEGFIKHNGCNFKLCGYWKVYGDTTRAQRTFENYNRCRKFLCSRLRQGDDIYHALKIS